MTDSTPKAGQSGESETVRKECPFPDCDWSIEKELTFWADRQSLEYKAERHYEREHAGRVKVQITIESEFLHMGRDVEELRERHLDDPPVDDPWEVAHVRTEVTEEPDEHPNPEDG